MKLTATQTIIRQERKCIPGGADFSTQTVLYSKSFVNGLSQPVEIHDKRPGKKNTERQSYRLLDSNYSEVIIPFITNEIPKPDGIDLEGDRFFILLDSKIKQV